MTSTETETETDTTDSLEPSTAAVALFKLAFPLAGLLLGVLYIESTFGRIRLSNLYYPFFVIGILGVITLTVLVDEGRELRKHTGELGFKNTIKQTGYKWRRSLGFTAVAIGYIWAIEFIGFVIATVFGMIGIMLVGGRRDPKWMIISTALILAFVYIMFVQIMGLRPPQGPLGL